MGTTQELGNAACIRVNTVMRRDENPAPFDFEARGCRNQEVMGIRGRRPSRRRKQHAVQASASDSFSVRPDKTKVGSIADFRTTEKGARTNRMTQRVGIFIGCYWTRSLATRSRAPAPSAGGKSQYLLFEIVEKRKPVRASGIHGHDATRCQVHGLPVAQAASCALWAAAKLRPQPEAHATLVKAPSTRARH